MPKTHPFELLLVEDDDVDVMNVKRALKKNHLDIPLHRATNGVEALDMLRSGLVEAPDASNRLVILLDLNMPKMGGLEFLQILRDDSRFRKLPVIVLSTSDQAEDLSASYQLNAAGYIVKPIDFQHFVEIMEIISQYWSICKMPV